MLEFILVGNIETGRLEAEVRNERYDLIAIVYEDNLGWQIEQRGSEKVPEKLLDEIKKELSTRPNRKGDDPPDGMSKGEHSLWLLS